MTVSKQQEFALPREGPKSPENILDTEMDAGVSGTLEGGYENTPTNRIQDFSMQNLSADGGTATMKLLKGPQLDGHHFYSTPADGAQSTLVKQTGLPQEPTDRSRVESEPIVETGPRPLRPFDANLPQLVVTKITLAASKQGFAGGLGGWRLGAVAGRTRQGTLTTTTEPVAFQHANGQDIEWYPPLEATSGIVEWVFFLSEEAATESALKASTMRQQDKAKVGTRTKRCKGPYDFKGRKRPTTNETFIGKSHTPRWGLDLNVRNAERDTVEMELLQVAFIEVNSRGEALASAYSQARTIISRENSAVYAKPKKHHPETTGYKVLLRFGSVAGGADYTLSRSGRTYRDKPFPIDEPVRIYGHLATEEGFRSIYEAYTTIIPLTELPSEDTSGIEAPTGEADAPIGIGASRPAAGTYRKTYAPVYGGIEQRAALPVRTTITSTEMLRLEIPSSVNRLANPAGTEKGADGSTLAWNDTLTNGVSADTVGKIGVATSGLVNDTSSATPRKQSDYIPVNQGVVETVRGTLEVTNYVGTGGFGRITLVQLLTDATTPGTTLAQRNTNGYLSFDTTIGPTGSGADIILDEGATDIAIRVGTSADAGRNMTVRGYDLAVHPFDGAPRKFVFPPEGTAAIADPDAPPEAPYPEGPVVCITRPKSATPPPGFEPVATLDASVTPDPTTAGWTKTKTANGLVVMNTTTFNGLIWYRSRSDYTSARAEAFYSDVYAVGTGAGQVNGSSLASRKEFNFPLLPSRDNSELRILTISTAAGTAMGYVHVRKNGTVKLFRLNANGNEAYVTALTGLSTTDVMDAELIVGGGDTNDGRVSLLIGLNGEQRVEVASIENIDFTGRIPREVRFAGVRETDTASKWEVLSRDIRVTDSGDVLGETDPDTEALAPDRPEGADAVLRELDEDYEPINQLYIHVPPNFTGEYGAVFDDFFVKPGIQQTVAIYARYEDAALQTEPTAKLEVFNAAGEVWEPTTQLIPASYTGTWVGPWDVDYYQTFTPDPGFYRARLTVKRTTSGMWIFQGPMLADGALTTQADRDAARMKGCSLSGTFRTLISGRVPDTTRLTPEMEEKWIRLGIDAEIPDGGLVTALYKSGPAPDDLGVAEDDWQQISPNQNYAEIEGTLVSDGSEPVRVPPGGAALTYETRMPTLLRADRSNLSGGSTVYGIQRAYERPDYRTESTAGRATPAPITDRIGRLDNWEVTFYTHEAVAEFEQDMLDEEWVIESPHHNAIHRVKLYEISEPEPLEAMWEEEYLESVVKTTFQVARAEILESGTLR